MREVEEFFYRLVTEESLALDPLVIDEVLYVSKRKYGVKYEDTIDFLDRVVLPASVVLPITREDYERAKEIIVGNDLKPSRRRNAGQLHKEDSQLGQGAGQS